MTANTDPRIAAMWEKYLGFIPERTAATDEHNKCLNCNSKNLLWMESPAWTGKNKCRDCGYYTFIFYQDKMGTVMPDDVAIDKRDSTMIPGTTPVTTPELETWTRWKVYFHNIASGEHFGGFEVAFNQEPTEIDLKLAIREKLDGRDMVGHYLIDVKKSVIIHEAGVMPTGNIIDQDQINAFNNRIKGYR